MFSGCGESYEDVSDGRKKLAWSWQRSLCDCLISAKPIPNIPSLTFRVETALSADHAPNITADSIDYVST